MSFRGLFIGLTTIDIQYFVDAFPEPNKKIKTTKPDVLVGGPATNAAVAFAKLNGKASLASATGVNAFSTFVANDFQLTGIKHFDLIHRQEINPVLATVVTSAENGDRTIFTHTPDTITPEFQPVQLFTNVNPDIILLDGFYPEFGIEVAQAARNRGISVVVDAGSWKPHYDELFPFAEVVICSEDFYPPGCTTSDEVFTYLKSRKVEFAAISRGGQSILYRAGTNSGEIKIKTTNVKDTLGAGDFLHGAFCYYYLEGNKNFKNALKIASVLASKTCEYEGTRNWLNFEL